MEFAQQITSGQVTLVTGIVWVLIAFVAAVFGGAIMGVRLAGKDLGNELAAAMGAMFGPLAVVPAVVIGLIVLALL